MDTTAIINTVLTSDIVTLSALVIITMLGKDLASKIAAGLVFVLNPNFKDCDRVLVNGSDAIIIHIGMIQTKFEVIDPECKQKIWMFISNDRLNKIDLCKVK